MPGLSYTDTGNLRERVVLVSKDDSVYDTTYKAVKWVFTGKVVISRLQYINKSGTAMVNSLSSLE